ncbi:SDR family oxidoreductase [Streptomyces sp. NPDC005811]|uniref:SDR family NAD(P)-dependent oxidoreductase n=1 Tax=Streptomyces sp. NPDC005811 TaxID=3154565 RepID=UPI0033F6FEB1
MELTDKVAVVVGGAGYIGSACSRRLAEAGATVVVADLAAAKIDEIVADIEAAGGKAIGQVVDVSEEASVVELVKTTLGEYGRIDSLANVAAALDLAPMDGDITTMEAEFWDRVMAVNLRGPMLTAKHFLPTMIAQGSGTIVNFTSTAAFAGDLGLIAYSSSKAAQIGLTRSIATTYGQQGVRCNVIAPSGVWSPELLSIWPDEMKERFQDCMLTPRLGEADDVAHLVVYLSSGKASYITGQTFFVDGGSLVHQPWVRRGSSAGTDFFHQED